MDLNQKQLAELFGCTTRALRKWHPEGLAECRNGMRQYDAQAAVKWYVEREVRRVAELGAVADDETGEVVNRAGWDTRLARCKAIAAELELQVRRGELIERAHVRDVLARVAALVNALPRREAPGVALMLGVEPRDAIVLLERVSDQIMGLLREALPDE